MKRITVGRGNDCDIVIIDETDNISRHHLVITFNVLGGMKVSDTSSNGTFINGTRMLKGTSIPVTKEDKIRLGRNTELDWHLVKDPYSTMRMIYICIAALLVIATLVFFGWKYYKEKIDSIESPRIEMIRTGIETDDNWNKDSTAKVAPTITSIDVKGKKSNSTKPSSKSTFQESNRKKKEVRKVNIEKEKSLSKEKGSELDSIAVL